MRERLARGAGTDASGATRTFSWWLGSAREMDRTLSWRAIGSMSENVAGEVFWGQLVMGVGQTDGGGRGVVVVIKRIDRVHRLGLSIGWVLWMWMP
jgi:hypothetical protein